MFRQILESKKNEEKLEGDKDERVTYDQLIKHPRDVNQVIESVWEKGNWGTTGMLEPSWLEGVFDAKKHSWDHLVYAYLVENTRIYSIFQRAIFEYRTSERLGPLSYEAVRWLEVTEEVFFTNKYTVGGAAPLSSVGALDPEAMRRNAYYRLLGYDLNHGAEDGRPYPFVKPAAANREFAVTLEALLSEVWKGIQNARNSSGTRDTDDAEILNLVIRLRDMLVDRRSYGKLAREEFWAVATMSWLHMAVESDTPIVQALQAKGSSAEQRLRKIGQLVGILPHAKTHHFLLLARQLSVFLRCIEEGMYQSSAMVQQLYKAPADAMMQDIISLYAVATGRDVKAKSVAMLPATRPALLAEPRRSAVLV